MVPLKSVEEFFFGSSWLLMFIAVFSIRRQTCEEPWYYTPELHVTMKAETGAVLLHVREYQRLL